MTEILYGIKDLAASLGITRQALEKADKNGKIQAPAYRIGKIKGWTATQVREIKEGRTNEKRS